MKKEEEMARKEIQAPYCHGEPMQAIYRYMSGEVMYTTWICAFRGCQNTLELPLYVEKQKVKK